MLTNLALAASALLSSPIPAPIFQGWGPSVLPVPTVAYEATIGVPLVGPSSAEDYAWIMAASPVAPFTQIGFAWFAPGNSTYTGPVIFAYSVAAGQTYSNSDWSYGPALNPGQPLTVRIVRSGTTYVDQYQENGSWVTLDQETISGRPLWSTFNETRGGGVPVCFSNRSYSTPNRTVRLPEGCQDA